MARFFFLSFKSFLAFLGQTFLDFYSLSFSLLSFLRKNASFTLFFCMEVRGSVFVFSYWSITSGTFTPTQMVCQSLFFFFPQTNKVLLQRWRIAAKADAAREISQRLKSVEEIAIAQKFSSFPALFWQDSSTVCCPLIVSLNWNGVRPGWMVFQIPWWSFRFWIFRWSVRQFFLLHIFGSCGSYISVFLIFLQGTLHLVPILWVCWSTVQPDATSTISFVWVWGPFFGWGLP